MLKWIICTVLAIVVAVALNYFYGQPKKLYAELNNHDIELTLRQSERFFESSQTRKHLSVFRSDRGPHVDMAGTRLRFAYLGDNFLVLSAGLDKEFGTDDDIEMLVNTKK